MMAGGPLLSIVIPAYHEAEGLAQAIATIGQHVEPLGRVEFVLVDDGSTDKTWDTIQAIARGRPSVRGVRLSRNFGKEGAIHAGLQAARGDAVVTIDADLQHPPELIAEMVALWESGAKVVNTTKRTRQNETKAKAMLAHGYFRLFRWLAGIDVGNAADFKLLDREVVDCLIALPERERFYRGLVAWVGFEQATISFDVAPRLAGEGKWNSFKLLGLAMDSIVSFSTIPMHLMTALGAVFGLVGAGLGLRTFWLWLTGAAVPGFATVILLLVLMGAILMVGLGIIGVYIAKIYEEVKRRPDFIVRERTPEPLSRHDSDTDQTVQWDRVDRPAPRYAQGARR